MKVSVICTVYQEREHIEDFLDSLLEQTKRPDEIILVDGGSDDGTWEYLLERAEGNEILQVYRDIGNISHGRNVAISKASGPVIGVVDAGTKYHRRWLAELYAGFNGMVSFGRDLPLTRNAFEREVGRQVCHGGKQGSSRNMMFLKKIWQEVGGYPEDLLIGEDTLFDERIRESGYDISEVKTAICYWRMRPTLKALATQFWRYGFWDGVSFSRHKVQPIKHLVFLVGFAGTLVFSPMYLLIWLSRMGRVFLARRLSYFFGFLAGMATEDRRR